MCSVHCGQEYGGRGQNGMVTRFFSPAGDEEDHVLQRDRQRYFRIIFVCL